jgi:3-oxoacyl-[acyl-carrier protein] reductase
VSENVDPRVTAAVVSQIPMGELAQPESIAHLALHLLSDEAIYTTGQIVSPNGGILV